MAVFIVPVCDVLAWLAICLCSEYLCVLCTSMVYCAYVCLGYLCVLCTSMVYCAYVCLGYPVWLCS